MTGILQTIINNDQLNNGAVYGGGHEGGISLHYIVCINLDFCVGIQYYIYIIEYKLCSRVVEIMKLYFWRVQGAINKTIYFR